MFVSPAHASLVSLLLLAGVFFGLAALVLLRHRVAVRRVRDEFEQELIEQLAQPREWMSQPVAPSQSTLQPVEGSVGSGLAGAALAAHAYESAAACSASLRGSEAKGAQTL